VLELQAANLASNRVAAEARPHLRTLQVQTGQRVHLAVYRGGDHVVYIDRVDNEDSIGTFVPVGRGGPVHATSLGKAILAFSPRDVVDTYLAESKRKQLTARTIVDASEIRRQLELVRSRGYATEMSESAEDICCIGAPIFDYTGQVVAAVSISGSVEEVAPNMEAFAKSVTEQASTISKSFGYRAGPVATRAI
jgi:IclR family KDG regulon transcriptional repressor